MAGHSKFKNIMYRKGAQDAKRAKLFTKLAKEITVAAKVGGPISASNPRLRAAIGAARAQSMPKDNIERAIKRASAGDTADYLEARYEGYGPANVAIIVEALTDNRNRTASEIRSTFNKNGGSMGETNSVAFNFDRVGQIHYSISAGGEEKVMEAAIEAGADDVISSEEGHDIYCMPGDLNVVQQSLENSLGEPESARLYWRSLNIVDVSKKDAETLIGLLNMLDDMDDVQQVAANYEIADDVVERIDA